MIYLSLDKQTAAVYFPLNTWTGMPAGVALTLRNTTDGKVVEVPLASKEVEGFLLLLRFNVPVELYPGEWEYMLEGNGETFFNSRGLLVAYNEDNPPVVQYNSSNNEVIQYDGN